MEKKKYAALLFALLFLGVAAASGSVALKPSHPDRYVVVKGDTLWDIAERFLRDPWLWPDIWYANPDIENPHLIYPGDVVKLVYVGGKPRIEVTRGRPTVKLTPKGRVIPLKKAIPTIPLDAIQPFLARPYVVAKDELEAAPYVVQSAGEHLIAGAGDRIYVRGIEDPDQQRYVVLRTGEVYRDPQTNEVLGYEAVYVGDAVLESGGDPSTLELVKTDRETLVGDRLMPAPEDEYEANFQPRAPGDKIEGQIISVLDGVSQIGRNQVVVLNRGAQDGLERGHVLAVYQKGEVILDTVSPERKDTVKLPDERAGLVMVFRTFDRVSYALVMRARTNMEVLDYVRNP